MNVFLLLLTLLAADVSPRFTSPKPAAPEYGVGLSPGEVRAGRVSLFVGEKIAGSEFGDYELKVTTSHAGGLTVGKQTKVVLVPRALRRTAWKGLDAGPSDW